jgi:hypothetical protein
MQIFVRTLTGKTTSPWPNDCLSDKSPPRTTSLRLARQVPASHDNSPPHTTSSAPTSAWAQTHGSGEATNACGEANSTPYGGGSWRPCRRPTPTGALNANLTSHTTITSPSTSALPHAKLSPRHSSILYDARGPRLRLTRGKVSKYSGRLKQAQTTWGEGQASRKE